VQRLTRRTLPPLAVLLVAVAGCSGGGGSAHVVSLPQPPAASRDAARPAHKDPYTASVQYVGCMRDHGIDLPDPKPNGDIDLTPAQDQRLSPRTPEQQAAHEAADKACFHFLRGAVKTKPLSDAARARMADVMLGFARCMRHRGYEFGDPVVRNMSRGRVMLFFPHEDPTVQRLSVQHNAKFQAAQANCERGQSRRLDKAIGNER
jgi:hypothetical protein